ncbi:ATP synthase F0 subunit B [Kitasatospora sp. NBC_01287]|uniref:ATP synthase F0 subunit B n=1 Tax=Kitasatospora sp. NBC_01287 TaxID=2903573 RepID=UPI00225497BD|nr:ATP synthase F0 subunit B [Kitasatospora sp. NBC_01287]MCX4746589.1 ATP synthase F0 subunit B [Kitasatospora sp. NBC_01287]
MDVQNRVDEIIAVVENARAMPMSASCVVNRAELVALLQGLREELPAELAQAQSVMADHQQVVADAHGEADRIIQGAHAERGSLISDTEVVRRAQAQADRILAEAREEVTLKRQEADDYVDSKLANFEVVLTKTLGAVGRGRDKLRGEGGYEPEDGEEFQPAVSPSPEVDEYVDAKLATLQAVLGGTLEAVGRGRDKLIGKAPIDELGAYLAAADQAQQQKDRAEAVAAGFAAEGFGEVDEERPWYREETPAPQSWPQEPAHSGPPADAGWQPVPGEGGGFTGAPAYPGQEYAEPNVQYAAAAQQGGYQDGYGGGYDPGAGQGDPYAGQYYQGQQQGDPYAAGYYQQEQPGGYPPAQPGYDTGYYQQQPVQQQVQPIQPASLDETSFFDTSMIDMTRLRELGGR